MMCLQYIKKQCRSTRTLLFLVSILALNLFFGTYQHLLEENYYTNFRYPYDGDVYKLVQQLINNVTPDVPPINNYTYKFINECSDKCLNGESNEIRLVYLIKSSPEHFKRRQAIRNTWGFEHRFSDVEIRRVFLLGVNELFQSNIDYESKKYGDIVQANFNDSYYNNTIKTMIGFKWAIRFCPMAKFYMIIDDDYYISTKNVLRFIRNPTNYPEYLQKPFNSMNNVLLRRPQQILDFELPDDVKLYSGYVFNSSPHRHFTSKWYISLKEYPYHMWPPYVTAGSVLLSKESLKYMYYASYYTRHFKFDDIYIALLALKVHIEPFHCKEFYFHKKPYNPKSYTYTIASHGYDDPEELVKIWTQQKSLGNA